MPIKAREGVIYVTESGKTVGKMKPYKTGLGFHGLGSDHKIYHYDNFGVCNQDFSMNLLEEYNCRQKYPIQLSVSEAMKKMLDGDAVTVIKFKSGNPHHVLIGWLQKFEKDAHFVTVTNNSDVFQYEVDSVHSCKTYSLKEAFSN